MQYQDMTKKEMQREYHRLCQRYQEYEQQGLQLDLSRGKPAPEQLALSQRMLGELNSRSVLDSEDGTDCRNYGGLDGIPEAKALLAGMIGVRPEQVMVGGNSSLTMMFDILSHAMLDGLLGAEPWVQVKDRKFLCPVPGYDRHFAMTEHFGFQLIPIPMHNDGPDMDMIEDLVQRDASIKGIWCVPKYQNPTGIVFSPMVVERFAHLQPAAPEFRIFWDNAYCVHDLYPNAPAVLPDILSACANAGHPDMVYEFCSTSKVSFPGAGISGVATSSANLIDLRKVWKFATIGPDKLNQLRQARFFRNESGIEAHMARHARLLRPKFEQVISIFREELDGSGIASWTEPRGGYFLSFDTMPGCAARTVELCRRAGVKFTPAGSTWPYGRDPQDSNIRIAPSFASAEEIEPAARLFTIWKSWRLPALHPKPPLARSASPEFPLLGSFAQTPYLSLTIKTAQNRKICSKSRTFPYFLSLNSAISSIFSVLYCASCTVFLICQNHGISKRQNVRQGTYKWRGMVVLWRHKERSKEGAETEHRRFPLSVFLLGALFIR